MATVNAKNIFLGAPDQSTTGAVLSAPSGTTLPTDATTALDNSFASSGYVSEDGVSLSWDRTTTNIKDWSAKTVRVIAEETTGSVSFALLEISDEGLRQVFGDDAVTKTAATSSHGTQMGVAISGEMPEVKAWVFNMKDGPRRLRLVVPSGQVTSLPDLDFSATSAVTIPVTITAYPDSEGVIAYFYADDGQTA